ncbi:glycosyltransferase family 4 protein [Pseudoalteromonas denitrificans]|uniref:Glycosyltransferase involved in cell wall bisynthesis n=1 Tax=Pseudoalteromonas denitrificans DSM 6059 TaxID=1123010 RepID=A0A1I1FJ68_9GAMM|nr:glycosyltransferase family 4 protein [Pseudoalteromonas denitrificans]SFB99331.1 Glycosyltransferase involved in cell wall bisynthesis [Pseudoalteromonas denitrificans DSM 6059]
MKKILVIGYVWPEPNSSAAGTHMLSLLRSFKKQDWLVEFATPAQKTEHMTDLDFEGITSKIIALNCTSFDDYIQIFQPDIVMFDRFMMEEQFGWRIDKYCPNALKILDTEDLQCLRNARHSAHKKNRDMELVDLHSDIAKREIAAILRCDISLIISTYEMKLLSDTFKISSKILHHLPFMVDLKKVQGKTKSYEERIDFMTIGNFRHAPNWDAVLYLQKIWPLIRKELPNAQLNIYGSYPPPKATALHNPKIGFHIKGWADNALEVMENAKLCLAPLRFGAGIKGKLLDAMIVGTPSITTQIGAEGMFDDEVWPGAIADNIHDFVHQAVTLYQDENKWHHAKTSANTLLKNKYDRALLEKSFISKINETISELEVHRLGNFTGSMLKHHTMASTKYMAQWIEAKNK